MCSHTYILDVIKDRTDFILDRHWHRDSEQYTSVDALFSALECGWEYATTVFCQEHTFRGGRHVRVFSFMLARQGELAFMSVVESPHVLGFIAHDGLIVHQMHGHPRMAALREDERETAEAPAVAPRTARAYLSETAAVAS